MKKIFAFLGLFCILKSGLAQAQPVRVTSLSDEIDFIPAIELLIDSSGRLSIKDIMQSNDFRKLDRSMINFGSNPSYLWLKVTIDNQSASEDQYFFISKGVDSLWAYQVDDASGRILKSSFTGDHTPIQKREILSSFLATGFSFQPYRSATFYFRVKNVNYPLSVYPFRLMNHHRAMSFLKTQDLFQSLYIGVMVFLILFSLSLLVFFKEGIYIYYLLCVLFSMTMMLVYNGYYYLIFDSAPEFIRNKNFFGVPTTLIPMFYLFFAREFLAYGYDKNLVLKRLIYGLSALTVFVVLVFLVLKLNFYQYRYPIYFLIFCLCFLTFVLVFRSIRIKYKPASLFLFATVPVLSIGVLETFSELHHIPVQLMHTIYYSFTVFELFVLTLGLAYRFKIAQDEKKKLQLEVFEIELQVQETERKRIAQDLHDKLGGLLGAVKLNFSLLANIKELQSQEIASLKKILKMLDLASEEVRNIAHSLASSTLAKLGLVPMLLEMYRAAEQPKVIIQHNNFNVRLEPTKEMALYAIIQESINNALKHAEADEIAVIFNQNEERVTVMIEDDGKGFEIQNSPLHGKGLENIVFRVKEILNGHLLIESTEKRGTIITIRFKV